MTWLPLPRCSRRMSSSSRSPAVDRPYQGRDAVVALLGVVVQVFENFRYVNEWRDGTTTILCFEANVGDRELQGIDILEEGSPTGWWRASP